LATLYGPRPHAGDEWILIIPAVSAWNCVDGPAFMAFIPPIDIRSEAASARDLFRKGGAEDYEASVGSRIAIINLILRCDCAHPPHTLSQGEPRSKKIDCFRRAKQAYPQWQNLIEEADEMGYATR